MAKGWRRQTAEVELTSDKKKKVFFRVTNFKLEEPFLKDCPIPSVLFLGMHRSRSTKIITFYNQCRSAYFCIDEIIVFIHAFLSGLISTVFSIRIIHNTIEIQCFLLLSIIQSLVNKHDNNRVSSLQKVHSLLVYFTRKLQSVLVLVLLF